jgi:hypothetical protein
MLRFRSPSKTLLPVLVLIEEVASIAPLLALMASGLDADNKVGSPFIPAMVVIALAGFWLVRRLSSGVAGDGAFQAGVLVVGLAIAVLAPIVSGLGALWNAQVLGIAILASGQAVLAWWRGIFYASHPESFAAEELAGIVQRSWLVLAGSLILIPILDGIDSDSAIDTAGIAVPIAALAALVILAIGQMERASKRSKEVGGNAPDRRRWLTFAGIFAVVTVLIAMVVSAAIGDDTSRTILTPFRLALDGVTFVLTWVLFGVAVVFLVLFYPLGWLIERFRPEPPEQQQQNSEGFGEQVNRLREGNGGDGFPHWLQLTAEIVAVIVIVAIVAYIITRTLKKQRAAEDDGEIDEEHESLWSRDLALNQLKGLFRRGGHEETVETLDLRRTPESVREAYRSLLALAQRDGVPRRDDETPAEFSARLRRVWPALATDVAGLTREYELAKYGDVTEIAADDRAKRHWATIWASRSGSTALK